MGALFQIRLKLIDEYLIEKVGVGSGSFPLGSPSSDRRRTVQIVTRWISVVRFGTIASAPTARHHLDLDSAVAAVAFRVTSRLIQLLLLFAGAPDQRTEPALLLRLFVFGVCGGGCRRCVTERLFFGWFSQYFREGFADVGGATVPTRLLLVEAQRERLSEFLQDAFGSGGCW
jgi:hypothetical protein